VKNKQSEHPYICPDLLEQWQTIMDILSVIMDVPIALIMRYETTHFSVYVKNDAQGNPFHIGEMVENGAGSYCESVIKDDNPILIPNALLDEKWANAPEIEMGLINYLGFPVRWPNGDAFGTICILNTKAVSYSEKQQQLMLQIKNIVESNLELLEKNQQLEVLSNNLQYLANTDDLTGIWNRRAFINESNKELKRSHRSGHIVCLLMMDIDDFKDINDAFGHEVGDEVLKLFSHCIQATKRPYDIFGRIGGEEFAILLPETGLKQATHLAERIRKKVSEIFYFTQGQSIKITVSIGVHQVDDKETNILVALNQADKLLYAAKHSGKNTVMATSL
tara:strand:+ start:106277 stop:107281 length:1005 start_codon:yes stop_codon:yes gene_type:complete